MRWILLLACVSACAGEGAAPFDPSSGWIVDADQARAAIDQGATILDVRTEEAYREGHVAGAARIDWLELSEPNEPIRGRLLGNDNVLGFLLRQKGVFADRDVIVVGDPIEGWGEDGRLVWALRTLGQERAAFVDGGHRFLVDAGVSTTTEEPAQEEGDFVVARTDAYSIDKAALLAIVLAPDGTIVVDNREPREYAGATPYGEARGGHLPGAISLYYKELLGSDGRLLSRAEMTRRLDAKGVTGGARVVAYCTGGVRSGWFVAVLTELGFTDVRNYAGSMWEWAAGPADEYPLEQ